MKNSRVQLIQSNEIYFDNRNDRYILIIREKDEIIGLNFCQGDDFEVFCDNFNEIDHELTFFYKSIVPYLVDGQSEIDEINAAMWAYLEFKNLKDSYSRR